MSTWEEVRLEDLLVGGAVSYGVVQPGNETEDGVPIVRVKDLVNGRINELAPLRVSPEVASRHSRTRLEGGEVLLSIVGSVGETALVPPELEGWNVARAIAVLRPAGVSPQWLQLCLQSPTTRHQIDSLLNTTVQATLNLADLRELRVPLPPEPVRNAIAEVLGALDDKIAANDTLARSADELLRSEYARLERESVDTCSIGDLAVNIREQVQPAAIGETTVYVGLEHIARRHMWMSDRGTGVGLASAKSQFRLGDTLFGKLRPYFHKVIRADEAGVCSTDILVVRARSSAVSGFLHAAASSAAVVAACTQASEGTRMPRTSWRDLAAVHVPWPGETAATGLSLLVESFAERVAAAVRESRTLAELRDTLLPALMSGRLSVKDAESTVSEVV